MRIADFVRLYLGEPYMAFEIKGLKTEPEGNRRKHWAIVNRKAKTERGLALEAGKKFLGELGGKASVVWLTRVSPGKSTDSDNIVSALKHIRDGIADALGTDDSPGAGIEWQYGASKGEWGVRVEVWR